MLSQEGSNRRSRVGASTPEPSASAIVDWARQRQDLAATETVKLFTAWLGQFCGDLALTLGALFLPVAPEKMSALATRLGLSDVPTLDVARAFDVAGLTVSKGALCAGWRRPPTVSTTW